MTALLVAARKALKPSAQSDHQFGDGGHVPVGVSDLDVAQISRERRHGGVNINTVSMPGEETTTDKGVPQVIQARERDRADGPSPVGGANSEKPKLPSCA
jgi:hypothetical protein